MIQRLTATFILIFLALSLVGATPHAEAKRLAVLSPDYAIVDDNPILVRGYYSTITAAVNSGATTIEIRAGIYPESVTLDRTLTINCNEGATLINDGESVSLYITAPNVTVNGCTIQGNHDGTGQLGDFFHGTGVYVAAPYARLNGLKTINLRAFSVLVPTAAAHHTIIEHCEFSNVATTPTPQLYAGTAIQFINGTKSNTVRFCIVRGHSQAQGDWYGTSDNESHNNEFVDNFGWIPQGFSRDTLDSDKNGRVESEEWGASVRGGRGGFAPRSAYENYGEGSAENWNNHFYNNTVTGSNGSGAELADRQWNTEVRNNEFREVVAGFWMGGSTGDYSRGAVIENNDFYGHSGVVSNWFSGTGTIKDNRFYDWDETATTGVIFVPSDGLGDVVIDGNTFDGGQSPLRYSAPVGTLRFSGNTVQNTDNASIGLIYLADTINPNAIISGNLFQNNGLQRVVNQNANTRVTVKDNVMYGGGLWLGANSVVSGNTFYAPFDVWTPLYIQSGMIARDNLIYADNTPIVIDGGATGARIMGNFVARQDGTAAALPTCTGTNVCDRNWTVTP